MTQKMFHGVPRDVISWNPSVNADLCIGCGQCLELCANNVFSLQEETGRVLVANPMNCVVLCDKCALLCPAEAITFPDKKETMVVLNQLFSSRSKEKANGKEQEDQAVSKTIEL